MGRSLPLPGDLSPAQVIAVQDALLSNADRLLQAALAMLERENVPLARSLAILGMEESGKAIALHERRVQIAHAPEGAAFVDQRLQDLWGQHGRKLEVVHEFLVTEEYWFDVEPANPEENARVLGTIEAWKRDHNLIKQRGFYVDVTADGDPVTPQEVADADAVRDVISHVHQIGWQLRSGEHIEGKRQLQHEQDVPPATEEEIEGVRRTMRSVDPEVVEGFVGSMREGTKGEKLNNRAHAFVLPASPFNTVGQPGYEAQDRELWALAQEGLENTGEVPDSTP
ncbi:AbiV family abortive infection protein [Rhodoglobus vestalii]|uniref:AbiV family abortive infection protein n=1 Tax=Rhodoglobus vestalii TaxID=193384 RepID=A0A8H2K7S0_9MICO|nr:AbiV family abortive infection protein [Rhodoglobus vestalii]TQO19241.1 AbiV family abortive infection protein [Rhodoglobus vestalii]